MDQSKKIKPVPSNRPTSPCSAASSCMPPNPYARDPSRRAIACVTCAKAKTRCDKALPSCSRCITKGIKCDPRSTRRTSDNNYRTLPSKKPFVAPKRFPTPGILPSSSTFPSPRSTPSRPSVMRAPSHIDFRTAVKMSQQAAIISSVPKLTPLPTYHTQIVDECYSYTPSPAPDLRFTPDLEHDRFAFSRGATPQTPADPFGFPEPLPGVEGLDYFDCQPWNDEALGPVGLGFSGLEMAQPWMEHAPEPEMVETNMFARDADVASSLPMHASTLSSSGWSSFQSPLQDDVDTSGFLSTDDAFIDSGIVLQDEWNQPRLHDSYVNMGNLITSAPYVPKMHGVPSTAPVWEDVFMPSSIAY